MCGSVELHVECVAQVLEFVLGKFAMSVECMDRLVRADHVGRVYVFGDEHPHIKRRIVRHDYRVSGLKESLDLVVPLRLTKCGFVSDHFVGDVVDGTCFKGDCTWRLVELVDKGLCHTVLLDCKLAKPVFMGVARRFGIEKVDVHGVIVPRTKETFVRGVVWYNGGI